MSTKSVCKILILLIAIHVTSAALAAEQKDLLLSKDAIEFTGQAPQGAELQVITVYSPEKSVASSAACQFKEDQYKMNGSDILVSSKVVADAQGHYSLKSPLKGIRKNCPYIFTTIYFNMDNKVAGENFRLESDQQVKEWHEMEAELGGPITEIKNIEDQKTVYCEFQAEEVGLCHINGGLTDVMYHVSTTPHQVVIDFKDISEQ